MCMVVITQPHAVVHLYRYVPSFDVLLQFPWAFRWRTFLYIEGAIMVCTAVLTGLHGLLSRNEQVKQRCQVLPSLAAAAHS